MTTDTPTAVLERYGGIATRAQLVGNGTSPSEITAAVREERIHRIRRAHYALQGADPRAVAAVRVGGRLTAGSATATYGLWGGFGTPLHVRLPSNAARLRPAPAGGVRLHWVDGRQSAECWRDDLEESLLAAARWETEEAAIAILDTAVGSGLVSQPRLDRILAAEAPPLRRLARRVRAGSESGIESLARQRFERAGRVVEQQVDVPSVGRMDMRVDGRLLLEFDGYRYHGSRVAFERDRTRDARAHQHGLLFARFTARQVLQEWSTVEQTVSGLLGEEPQTMLSSR